MFTPQMETCEFEVYAQEVAQVLPRIDQLWYKYIHMEEMLGNVAGARQIFERWMQWAPDHHGWMAYIKVRAAAVGRGGAG